MKKIAFIGAGISGLFITNLFKKIPYYQITIYGGVTSIDLDEGYGVPLSVYSFPLFYGIGFGVFDYDGGYTPARIHFYSYCSLD
jgi:hypothetical protein